ncbi:MAG TPA: glycoside hydrolase family 3 N-terminal domain-containing protein [Trebonia sp.]|nr:glycoside hydrolase family 3 N-terminal domain-containing protein [Trebonia sp.]
MTKMTSKRAFPAAPRPAGRWRAVVRPAALAAAALAACAGCSAGAGADPAPTASVAQVPSSSIVISPTGAARPSATGSPAASDAPASSCTQRIYNSLTEAQRVGQLFVVGLTPDAATSSAAAAIDKYHFGSVLLTTSAAGVPALATATAGIQALATAQATGGVKFLIAANQEGGQIQQLTGTGFATMPSELLQGQLPLATLRADTQVWGSELKAAGVNLDLAPVMDVVPQSNAANNAPIGQLDREFGYDPVTNGTHGAAYIEGMAQAGVAATAKHFPGLGQVQGNTDFTSGVTDTVTTINAPDLASFQSAINAGVPFVMVALALYTQIDPTHFAVFSPVVIQQMLRQRMGFKGVIVSDDIGEAAQVQSIPAGRRATDFLNAGGDLITSQVIPPAETMAADVLADANSSPSFHAVVAAAVMKVLAAKQALDLLPC